MPIVCSPEITIPIYQFRADDVAERHTIVEVFPAKRPGSLSLMRSDHQWRDHGPYFHTAVSRTPFRSHRSAS